MIWRAGVLAHVAMRELIFLTSALIRIPSFNNVNVKTGMRVSPFLSRARNPQ